MSTPTPQAPRFTGWAEVLASLEHTLNYWLAHSVEPLPGTGAWSGDHVPAPAAMPLQLFEERLDRLQASLGQAEQNAEQALAPLTAEIESVRRWLETLTTVRSKLEQWSARAV